MRGNFRQEYDKRQKQNGFSLLELIIATMILLILTSAAIANLRFTALREREWELRADLREMRNAIDKYKDYADKNLIQTAVGTNPAKQPPLRTPTSTPTAPTWARQSDTTD